MSERKTEGLSILAVDDNEMNLVILKNMFRQEKYRVHYASSGRMALDMARELHPDMILLDVFMHDIGGFEVCRQLKQEDCFRNIPVIFITAADESDFQNSGFEAGGADYITKPFRKEELLLRIRKHFGAESAGDQP